MLENKHCNRKFLIYILFLGALLPSSFVLLTINPIKVNAATITEYYVSPDGTDVNTGTSLELPFKTIQQAVNIAQPGDIINLQPGEYREDVVSYRDGTANSPITITGTADAVVRGGGNDRVIEINHDYYTLDGFTIDGLHGSSKKESGYRDILIYALGKEIRQGVEGLKILNMTIKNSGGECVRLRYFVTKAEIAHNTITNCGIYDFVFNSGGKNGEGIYVGTSNKQWKDGKNPTSDPDETRDNLIHHNYIDTQGNECVDIKEGSTANIVEYNTCIGQKDSESGGFDSRGDENIFRYNNVSGSIGGGVRLGGSSANGIQYGKNNDVYGNTITDNKDGGIKFQIFPQGKICENTMSGNSKGNSAGNYGSKFDPTKLCDNTSSISENTPAPEPTSVVIETQKNVSNNTNSLATNTTLIAHSDNFSDGYSPVNLWDGCYEGDTYDSDTCTSGGRDISSFWLEFDLGKLYNLSETKIYGDADGEWVSKTWTLQYKKETNNSWTTLFSNKNAFSNNWLIESLGIKARFVRIEVFGDDNNFSPGKTQAREFELYGTEIPSEQIEISAATPPSSGGGSSIVSSSSGNNEGGGGSSYTSISTTISQPSVQTTETNSASSQPQKRPPLFTKSLFQGTSDEQTYLLQTLFAKDSTLYPEGLITGYYGTLTKKAVQRFQCKHNIVCSGTESTTGYGTIGPKTRAKLNEIYAKDTPAIATKQSQQLFTQQLFTGLKNDDVIRLQTLLAKDSTLYPEGLITGYYGTLTKKAVQRFQCKHNIVCSGTESTTGYGRVGPKTITQLN